MHSDLIAIKELLYNECNFSCSLPVAEIESAKYGAYSFRVNEQNIRFRVAKITPTKVGQFVTLWKRVEKGPIQPFDTSDDIDLFVISTRDGDRFGQFVFPKSVLVEKKIVSANGKEGKRGFRVYPPWDKAVNKQAQKTQKWQLDYFLEVPSNRIVDQAFANILYSNHDIVV